MTLRKSMSVLSAALLVASALFVSSCDDTTTTPTAFIPAAPSSLMALSAGDSTIRIMFTPSTSESNTASFTGYRVTATSGSSTKTFTIAPAGGTGSAIWANVAPLDPGKTWNLSLVATSKDSVSTPVSISWATATRYIGLRAYERSSSLGSGINLLNGTQKSIAAADQWDLCFDSDNGAFGAPGASAYVKDGKFTSNDLTAKRTYIFGPTTDSFYYVNADSLNAVYETKMINDTTTGRKQKIEGTLDVTTPSAKSFVFYVLTQENNFAKILLKATSGSLIQTDASGKYVQLDASVQRTASIPYAMRTKLNLDGKGVFAPKIMTAKATF